MLQHDFPFDPTYGYDEAALRQVGAPPGPPDLADFWRDLNARTRAIAPRATVRELTDDGRSDVITHEIDYDSLDGFRVGGWLTVPKRGEPQYGVVVGHGYGGREAPDYGPMFEHAVAIFPCARGFNRSARPDLPNTAAWHVLHGIESRHDYSHGKCAADLWAGINVLQEMFPATGPVHYVGSSFGGGIGAMALPWDDRFGRAFLEVPSFGNHPLRLTLPCNGSGEAVRTYHRRHPAVLDVLQYFDAATIARHARVPTLVAAALFDPAVPPPGQFAVYNALAGPKQLFVRTAGHVPYPQEAAELEAVSRQVVAWFGDEVG
jgi:cephalosporin-C deacetylase